MVTELTWLEIDSIYRLITYMKNKLIGLWKIDPADTDARLELGEVMIEFKEGGNLVYIIKNEDKDEIILLNYKIKENCLITNQPSMPKEERTVFELDDEGGLVLEYGGKKYRYTKVSD